MSTDSDSANKNSAAEPCGSPTCTVGIIQPNYIAWRGYFDFIREVDTFVFLDDVQYTTRDWRNRNKIKQFDKPSIWLTVPVTGGRNQLICDVKIDGTQEWANKHFNQLAQAYGKTPYFDQYADELREIYRPGHYEYLAHLTVAMTILVSEWLGLDRKFELASNLRVSGTKDDRLLALVKSVNGNAYLSGPSAEAYIRPELWSDGGVALRYKNYSGYPEYAQISKPFDPFVSVLDLLFMLGDSAADYIWGEHRIYD